MRLLFGPDYCHYCVFSTISSSPSLALAFEVSLAGLMLIVSVPVDLVFGLTLIVATSELLLVSYAGWFSLKPLCT